MVRAAPGQLNAGVEITVKWLDRVVALFHSRAPVRTEQSDNRPVAWSSMAGLLEDLEQFGSTHEELYDTDVRERLWEAVDAALIRQSDGYAIPTDLGMFSPEANTELASIMSRNIERLRQVFAVFRLDTEQKRLASFLNPNLRTESGRTVDEFFGHP